MSRMTMLTVGLAAMLAVAGVRAHGDEHHAAAPRATQAIAGTHGGKVVEAGGSRFEVVFTDQGVMVFPSDSRGRALPVAGAMGLVRLRSRAGDERKVELVRMGSSGEHPAHLWGAFDLTGAADGSHKALFQIEGVKGVRGAAKFTAVLQKSPQGGHAHGGGTHDTAMERPPAGGDAEIVHNQLAGYPLSTCVVSGEKLGGEMGPPIDYIHAGRLVRFCCKACIKEFKNGPAPYLAKIDAARSRGRSPAEPMERHGAAGSTSSHGAHDHGAHGH